MEAAIFETPRMDHHSSLSITEEFQEINNDHLLINQWLCVMPECLRVDKLIIGDHHFNWRLITSQVCCAKGLNHMSIALQ